MAENKPTPNPNQTPAQVQTQQQSAQAVKDAQEADVQRREAAGEQAKKQADAARKQSLEVLKEQESMKPVPSQEDADKIKAGAYDPHSPAEGEVTDGPAQRAAEANAPAGYETRQVRRQR